MPIILPPAASSGRPLPPPCHPFPVSLEEAFQSSQLSKPHPAHPKASGMETNQLVSEASKLGPVHHFALCTFGLPWPPLPGHPPQALNEARSVLHGRWVRASLCHRPDGSVFLCMAGLGLLSLVWFSVTGGHWTGIADSLVATLGCCLSDSVPPPLLPAPSGRSRALHQTLTW